MKIVYLKHFSICYTFNEARGKRLCSTISDLLLIKGNKGNNSTVHDDTSVSATRLKINAIANKYAELIYNQINQETGCPG
jgi:hypothetical protein